ncbi:hypothetical protein PCCS19_11440 [Paenibacillus sp. CCS19]|uniref:CotH kinase family protein n=1 Tax=Paenibacillus sp. CCS19 TaxID=3158387 RepID=UPI002566C28D|nr:CotH kinase family protein [Paenibacillus cellulosilyticus]GMK38090.1 hypothetical protein PCCS19_11440 [Paenibacillus cellulosilyticus]
MKSKTAVPILVACMVAALIAALLFDEWHRSSDNSAVTGGVSAAATTEQLEKSVFVKDKVVDVKITLDPDDFQNMLDNASAEEFKTATVEYNGIKLENVGVRTKGNLSLRAVVQMQDSDRYSFKLSFDEYISSQTLQGISKINLNNNYSDATYMREFLTYELAKSMGLPTPEYSYVNVYVNGELRGLYLAVEQVGESYLNRNFGNSYGALYKGIMGNGSDLIYRGDEETDYPGLERKSEKSNGNVLVDMIKKLNEGTDIESVIDVEDALGYIALNAVTVNTDSYIGGNKQNYYLYENNGIFSILPWDYNMAFSGLGGMFGGGGGGGGESSNTSNMIDEPTDGSVEERPLVAKLLSNETYKAQYHEMIQSMIDNYLNDETFQARVKQLQELIADEVKADPTAFYTYEQFEQGVQSLLTFTSSRVANVQGQLDGTIKSSGDGSGNGGGFGGFGGGRRGGNNMAANGANNAAVQEGNNAQDGNNAQGNAPAAQGGDGAQNLKAAQADVSNSPTITTASLDANNSGLNIQTVAVDADTTDQNSQAAPNAGNGGMDGQAPPDGGQGGQGGQFPQEGQFPQDGGQGMQGGFGGEFGGMAPPDGANFGGGFGGPGGFGGNTVTNVNQGSTKDAITTGSLLIVLVLAMFFIVNFRKKH